MTSTLPAIPTAARSMLEDMLAALKLKEEKPKDAPPALPARPTMRRRPPSTKHNLPTKLKDSDDDGESSPKDSDDATKDKAWSDFMDFSIVGNETDKEKSNHSKAGKQDFNEEMPDGACNVHVEASNKNYQKMQPSRLDELEKLIFIIKDELRQKEEENVALQQQVQQQEKKRTQCEEQMNSMEEVYQRQLESLKISLTAAQKSITAAGTAKQVGCLELHQTAKQLGSLDAEGATFAAARTPEEAPARQHISDARPTWDANEKNHVHQLVMEFEKQKRAFEDEVQALDVKSGKSANATKSLEELRRLKTRYAAWKKDYKVRLHDARKALEKLAKSSSEKHRTRWWCSCKCARRKRNRGSQ